MSSFNLIKKVKHNKNQEDPISLKEYMLFTDERHSNKYVLFKFFNSLNQNLKYIKFEVFQYDQDNNIVEKTVIEYDKINANGIDWFVPNAKMIVNQNCEDIIVKVIYAKFESLKWEDDKLVPLLISSDNGICKPQKPIKKRKNKKYIRVKNIKNRNKIKSTKIFTGVLSLILMALIVVSLVYTTLTSENFSDGSINYRAISDETAEVVSCDSTAKNITIPKIVNNYLITKVADNAFKDSNITSFKSLANNFTIGENAFENCKNLVDIELNNVSNIGNLAFYKCKSLTKVDSENTLSVGKKAFAECLDLKEVNFPNAKIELEAFSNDFSIKNFVFGSTEVDYFYKLFAIDEINGFKLDKISTNMKYISNRFFIDSCNVNEINFSNSDIYIEYGALEPLNIKNYTSPETIEVLNGVIVGVDEYSTRLYLSKEVIDDRNSDDSLFEEFLLKHAEQYTSLEFASNNIDIDRDLLENFSNLNTLIFKEDIKVDINVLKACPNLTKISIETSDIDALADAVPYLESLTILGKSRVLSSFEKFHNLREIFISKEFGYMNSYIFNNCNELKRITIPNIYGIMIENLVLVEEIIILNSSTNDSLSRDLLYNLPNLKYLVLPNNINYCGENIISFCPKLSEITFPNSIVSIRSNVIGYGCDSLKKVTAPMAFKNGAVSYMNFNSSYLYTEEMVITKVDYMSDEVFLSCNNVKKLTILGDSDSHIPYSALSNFTELNYLKIDFEIESLANIFRKIPLTLKTVDLASKSVKFYLFGGAYNIENIILRKAIEIENGTFNNLDNLKNLYLGPNLSYSIPTIKELDSLWLSDKLNVIYGSDMTYKSTNNYIEYYKNIDYDDHYYTLVIDGYEVKLNKLIISDISDLDILKYYKHVDGNYIDFTYSGKYKFEIYTDDDFSNKVTSYYFAEAESKLYIKRVPA